MSNTNINRRIIFDRSKCKNDNAIAYFEATGITGQVEKDATCTLASNLNYSGLLAKYFYLNPLSASSLEATRYNLVDPSLHKADILNDDGTIFSPQGVEGNDTDQYYNLNFNPVTKGIDPDSWGFTIYINTDFKSVKRDFGSRNGAIFNFFNSRGITDNASVDMDGAPFNSSNLNSIGRYTYVNDGVNEFTYKNGVQIGTRAAVSASFNNLDWYFMAWNNAGVAAGFNERKYGFLGFHQAFTPAEVVINDTIVATCQTNIVTGGR